jgi:hypothetical protein
MDLDIMKLELDALKDEKQSLIDQIMSANQVNEDDLVS